MPEPQDGVALHNDASVVDVVKGSWILQCLIRFSDGVEFQHLCEHYLGHRGEFVQDFVLATAPGIGDRCVIYRVPDDSALATYIRIARPHWIDYTWARHSLPLDPDDTFVALQGINH